jgi:hypothetical protein
MMMLGFAGLGAAWRLLSARQGAQSRRRRRTLQAPVSPRFLQMKWPASFTDTLPPAQCGLRLSTQRPFTQLDSIAG